MAATLLDVCAVVPAAGFGRRMQSECPKQYLSIGNKTILEHSVAALLAHPRVTHVVIAISLATAALQNFLWQRTRKSPWWMAAMSAPIQCWPVCRPPEMPAGCWCMMQPDRACIRTIYLVYWR